jgi:isopentenyl-diphosphate delta-isomerase
VALERRGEVEYSADVGNGLHEHERVTMFVGEADAATLALAPNPDEVMETRWVTPAELAREIAADPAAFTPWFRIYCERYPDLRFRDI